MSTFPLNFHPAKPTPAAAPAPALASGPSDEAVKKLEKGGIVVISGDGNAVSPVFLKVFKVAASDVDMISLMALHGTATAVFMTVVNFHRGTSRGSEDKSKQISSMINKG